MKVALLGDIHGNALALSAVLSAAKAAEVERLLITGDLVGYYFEPLNVLEQLGHWQRDVVRGNHEEMLSKARTDPSFLVAVSARYGSGLGVALEQLNERQLDEVCGLPHPLELTIGGSRVLLCHGSPWDINQYVYPDASQELLERCAESSFDLVVMGHTHYPMIQRIRSTLLINPGSVGQPRNRKPGASWALFDTESGAVELRTEQYDVAFLVDECRRRHSELPYLSEVLLRV